MMYLFLFISSIYILLIISFIIGFDKIPITQNKNGPPKNTFSIVIPFRNEARNLPSLLNSLSTINYSKKLFEIILVNDSSNDKFQPIIDDFTKSNPAIKFLLVNNERSSNSPKKDAITTAIGISKFEWIITTDADCIIPTFWLQQFNQFIEEENPLFISAPVKFKKGNSFLFHFQNLNFTSLIGSTIGGFGIHKPIMCNGANLCYHKDTFNLLNGFSGNTAIASGDDVFLLEKMYKAYPNKTKFLKSEEAIVETNPEKTINSFLNQQIRWASKSAAYKSNFSKFVGSTVLAINLILIVLLIATIITPFLWKYLLIIFIQKIIVDFILINKTSSFLSNTQSFKHFVVTSIIYPFFIVFTGILSLFKSYTWKGRIFKK